MSSTAVRAALPVDRCNSNPIIRLVFNKTISFGSQNLRVPPLGALLTKQFLRTDKDRNPIKMNISHGPPRWGTRSRRLPLAGPTAERNSIPRVPSGRCRRPAFVRYNSNPIIRFVFNKTTVAERPGSPRSARLPAHPRTDYAPGSCARTRLDRPAAAWRRPRCALRWFPPA